MIAAEPVIRQNQGVIRAAKDRTSYSELTQLPNVGPAIAADLRLLGIREPVQLVGRDPYAMYESLCKKTRQRHDPCVIDVFISAVRFMEGAPARPWWRYTAERKARITGLAAADRLSRRRLLKQKRSR